VDTVDRSLQNVVVFLY